ncbi:AAA family ATPase [Planctomicrobium sp. SH661]|uniref:AAA family ATPase n=1 Tax=Planctomicrobium sp. SH661 TaxID=3448124 RepID=UPI003F5AEFB1
MSLLKKIQRGKQPLPPRLILYGTEGIGKSTFASEAPSPVFIQTEDGLAEIDCDKFPLATRLEDVQAALQELISEQHDYPMRRKAGKEPPGVIDQPCLVVYGTAIPTHYYGALSERMLTNGFFARMLIVESGRRSVGQDPGIIDPPAHLINTAQWWADFCPGTGNLENWHPQPKVVPATDAARSLLRDSRVQAESEYSASEARGDPVGTTVWGRVHEQTRKLALLYAVSENHTDPVIDTPAVSWASEFVMHQTRRMLFMAHGHVAENPFHAECLKLIKKLREAPDQTLPHSTLLKRMKLDSKSFAALIDTLCQQGEVQVVTTPRAGWPVRAYRLLDGETCPRGEP